MRSLIVLFPSSNRYADGEANRSRSISALAKNNFLVLAQYVEGNGLAAIEKTQRLNDTWSERTLFRCVLHFNGSTIINLRFFPSEVE
jgi:hypothetical protein